MSDQTASSLVETQPQAASPRQRLTEDWAAVVSAFLLIGFVLLSFHLNALDVRGLVPSLRWTTDGQIAAMVPGWNTALDEAGERARSAGRQPIVDAAAAVKKSLADGDRRAVAESARRLTALDSRSMAGALGTEIRGHAVATETLSTANLTKALAGAALVLLIGVIGIALKGDRVAAFILAVPAVFILALFSRLAAGNGLFVTWGIEYVIFALLLGLLISNTIGVPEWLKPAIQTEFFIKTGLVVLGASLVFSEIMQAGALGLLQSVFVIFVVWYVCFWLCRKLRVDDEFAAMLSTAVSICGVSAAIAACGAIQGDRRKLSYVTSLVLIVAIPMMIVMPWIAKATGMNDIVAGAWLGGTLDTSASVVAAGALVSDTAMKVGVIVKFSQNALIGFAALGLAIWWALRAGRQTGEKPSAWIIWERFPKFVIGFVIASIVFSFALPDPLVAGTRGALGELRLWLFALAFVCIGLETRILDLVSIDEGRPALAFIGAQAVNVLWTLILAFLLFGGILLAQPVIR